MTACASFTTRSKAQGLIHAPQGRYSNMYATKADRTAALSRCDAGTPCGHQPPLRARHSTRGPGSSKPCSHLAPAHSPPWRTTRAAPRPPLTTEACSSGAGPVSASNATHSAADAAAVTATAVHHAATDAAAAAAQGSIRIRDATPGDASALAALDARCAACGSSGWSDALYRADLQPGGPNLILVAELLPSPSPQTQPTPLSRPPTQPNQPTDHHVPCSQGPGHNHHHQPATSASDTQTPAADSLTPPPPWPSAGLAQDTSNNTQSPQGVPQHQGSAGPQGHGAGMPAVDASGEPTGTAAEAEAQAAVVGLACGCCVAGCEASLTNLAVCPSLRGRGLGRTLATELLSRLGADMLPCVLEVRVDNGRAQQLYGKLGFQVAGRRKKYNADGTDSLVMLRQPGPLA